MTKFLIGVFLFTIILYGCSPVENEISGETTDLEMDVINDILPHLIPDHPPCVVAPIKGESNEDYDKREQAFYKELDSVGKKVEIVSLLSPIDSNYIQSFKDLLGSEIIKHLLNAPNETRVMDSTKLRKVKDIRIVLFSEPRRDLVGLSDCYTLGQINFSRVGFNSDSTKAAFTYLIDDGSCSGGKGGIVEAALKHGKWRLIK
jgi:hypothetical protein